MRYQRSRRRGELFLKNPRTQIARGWVSASQVAVASDRRPCEKCAKRTAKCCSAAETENQFSLRVPELSRHHRPHLLWSTSRNHRCVQREVLDFPASASLTEIAVLFVRDLGSSCWFGPAMDINTHIGATLRADLFLCIVTSHMSIRTF